MPKKPRPCSLYRHYDLNKALLYVGVSVNAAKRTSDHSRGSPWFLRVRAITVEHFSSKSEALAAEGMAILMENPIFNKARHMKYIEPKIMTNIA
jgi:excinuclease UvrABC nuclease subunit